MASTYRSERQGRGFLGGFFSSLWNIVGLFSSEKNSTGVVAILFWYIPTSHHHIKHAFSLQIFIFFFSWNTLDFWSELPKYLIFDFCPSISFLKKYFCPSISFLILGQVSQFFLFSDFWSELPKYLFFPFSFFLKI